jgi:hypothetical protein
MGAVSGPKKEMPKPTGWQVPVAITKGVILDPGIVYTSADVLLFAGTNPVGFGAMLTATGIAAGLKTTAVMQPSFLDKHPRLKAFVHDDRTPLRAGAVALLVVAGATFAGGMMLPAAASLLFAIANYRLAESISSHHKEAEAKKAANSDGKPKNKAVEFAKALFTRPDFYLNSGFACAGLMAGGASLFVLPLVALAFGVSIRNALKGKPEHAGHPKMITGTAAGVFAGIGHANGHGLIAAAHALNAIVLMEMERRVTPGGYKQIAKDMAESSLRLLKMNKLADMINKPAPQPEPQPVQQKLPFEAPQAEAPKVEAPKVEAPKPEPKPVVTEAELARAFGMKATHQTAANENKPVEPPKQERGQRPPTP